MDKTKAVLEEIDQKAANSSDTYELIMSLIKEASSKLQASSANDRFLTTGVIGGRVDCGYLYAQR